MPLSIDWNISSPKDLLNELRLIISCSDEFKDLPRKQRAIYAAIRGELIECLQEESDNLMEQCEIYLRIIEYCCDLEDWQLAKNLILSNAHEKQTISEEISILGFYEDKCKIYINLIGRIDLNFDCFLWGEIGVAYNKLGDADNAIKYHEKQLKTSKDISNFSEILGAYNGLASIYNYSRIDIQQVLDYAQNSLELIKTSNIQDYKKNIHALIDLGWAYCDLKKFKKTIVFMKEALFLAEKNKDLYMISYCLTQLGIVYGGMQDFSMAVEVLSQQVKTSKKLKYRRLEAVCLCNLSMFQAELYGYKNQEVFQEYINYSLDALEISKKIKDRILENVCYNNLSALYLRKKEYEKALQYLQEITIGYLGSYFDCGVLSNFCYAYACQRNFSYATEYGNQAISISRKIKNKEVKVQILAMIHWYQGKHLEGIGYIIKYFWLSPPWKNPDTRFVFITTCAEIRDLLKSKLNNFVNILKKVFNVRDST